MMRVLLLLPLWLALATGDSQMLHTCPMHHAGVGAQAAAHMHAGHTPASPSHDSHHAACSCVGPCCCTGGWTPAPTIVTVATTLLVTDAGASLAAVERRHTDVARLLPFANGPPQLA
ncbi:MAG TPA: hypothetical protein VJ867_08880 [Gemmatimonadaceae bacterium]|nr:hypothetical protein [Gemmatimonadaceae bacterium]